MCHIYPYLIFEIDRLLNPPVQQGAPGYNTQSPSSVRCVFSLSLWYVSFRNKNVKKTRFWTIWTSQSFVCWAQNFFRADKRDPKTSSLRCWPFDNYDLQTLKGWRMGATAFVAIARVTLLWIYSQGSSRCGKTCAALGCVYRPRHWDEWPVRWRCCFSMCWVKGWDSR